MNQQEIKNKYHEQAQAHIDFINQAKAQFEAECDQLKREAETALFKLKKEDPDYKTKHDKIKIDLKRALLKKLKTFELTMQDHFIDKIIELEKTFNQYEQDKLKNLEQDLEKVATL